MKTTNKKKTKKYPGYPLYPANEDVYKKFKKEELEGPTKNMELTDNDLDIPGSELDDQQEAIGSEDEENNYYSLGGDNHEDLEENKGE
jgi:hypothetical protein